MSFVLYVFYVQMQHEYVTATKKQSKVYKFFNLRSFENGLTFCFFLLGTHVCRLHLSVTFFAKFARRIYVCCTCM